MGKIQDFLNKIRTAKYGREVRESIASAIEETYNDASKDGNANMEVSNARGNYETLNERLDGIDEKIKEFTMYSDSYENLPVVGIWIDGKKIYRYVFNRSLTITGDEVSRKIPLPFEIDTLISVHSNFEVQNTKCQSPYNNGACKFDVQIPNSTTMEITANGFYSEAPSGQLVQNGELLVILEFTISD